LINIFRRGIAVAHNPIVAKAVERYVKDIGELGCIGDASCECFKCELEYFALNVDREQGSHAQDFTGASLSVRDMLQVIVDGQIERGHCVGGREAYGVRPGFRKVMLKDAVAIAKTCVAKINNAVNKWNDAT
jgi:hypothetical protein